MSTTNGGPAPAPNQPAQLTVVAQYIKDFSFENPNAPQSLTASGQPPQIAIQINVNAKPLAETTSRWRSSLTARRNETAV